MDELIERLQRATGPSRELDAAINLEVFSQVALPDALNYTGSLDSAKVLIPTGHVYVVGDCDEDDSPWACVTSPAAGYRDYTGQAATDVLALCIAALKSRETEAE